MSEERILKEVSVDNIRSHVEHIVTEIPSRLAGSENGRRMAGYSAQSLRDAGAQATVHEGGRLKVARGLRGAQALKAELLAFRVRVSPRGHDAYAGAGEHDDLVIAAALACWRGQCGATRRGRGDNTAGH